MLKQSTSLNKISTMFKALGDHTRLRIFEFLCSLCEPVALGESGEVQMLHGATAGEVCCHVTGEDRITSTISFHLKELRNAGLISMQRKGKNMICQVDRKALEDLTSYLGMISSENGSGCCENEMRCE